MINHGWAGTDADFRYDLWEPRLQLYGAPGRETTAVVSYTFMLTIATPEGPINHRQHNESRVLIKGEHGWQLSTSTNRRLGLRHMDRNADA